MGLISTSEGVNCEHCGKYFKVLGRHIWRCKARLSTTPLQSMLGNGHGTAQELISPIESAPHSLTNYNCVIQNSVGEAHETDYDLETRKQTEKDPAIECHCGKKCKGLRGLRAHRRFCQFGAISDLNSIFDFEPNLNTSRNESTLPENNDYLNTQKLDRNNDMPQKIDVKAGIKLPKTIEEWNAANEYFKATIN